MTRDEAKAFLESVRPVLSAEMQLAIKKLEQEPRKGYWKTVLYEETLYCSECNLRLTDEQTYIPLHYCPNCGAKMESEDEK